ncbi:MAG: exopolysaccharide biosynthesis protein [Myxococcota bacterium]|nr:exopolysaccharide biosynthesis protein [Myxococcota bacterium]
MDVDRARDTVAPPRRLRMSELLLELGALEENASDASLRTKKISVGELVDKAAEAGFGFVVGILALIAIPFFGVSTPFGLLIALLGVQMIGGKQQPWLPQRARRRQLSISMLDRVATMLSKRTRWLVKMTKRRHEPMVAPKLVGFGITLLALGLALPLPIPGSNLVFLVPIFIYAVGLLERDGVWIALAHIWLIVDIALLFVFGATVLAVLEQLWAWIT